MLRPPQARVLRASGQAVHCCLRSRVSVPGSRWRRAGGRSAGRRLDAWTQPPRPYTRARHGPLTAAAAAAAPRPATAPRSSDGVPVAPTPHAPRLWRPCRRAPAPRGSCTRAPTSAAVAISFRLGLGYPDPLRHVVRDAVTFRPLSLHPENKLIAMTKLPGGEDAGDGELLREVCHSEREHPANCSRFHSPAPPLATLPAELLRLLRALPGPRVEVSADAARVRQQFPLGNAQSTRGCPPRRPTSLPKFRV
jgi:hypothetical protein